MKFRQKNFVIIGLVVTVLVIGAYTLLKINTATPKSNNQLIIGVAAGYAPFVSINQNGEYEGFDIDVANELAAQMNKQLILKDLGSMTALFTALQQGNIDAIIWGLSITQDRLKKVAMVHYQGATTKSYPLIFWERIPQGITSISDLSGKIVCVEPGSSQEAVLNKFASINKIFTEKVDDALLNIQYGKADAALVEPAIAKKFKNKYPEIQMLDVPLNEENQVYGIGIVIKKENNAIISSVQKAVDSLKSNGKIAQLEQKWGIT